MNFRVSIPFKRESTFKQATHICCRALPCVFQFPSNGKAHLNDNVDNKKEQQNLFQFPSNGKAHLNDETQI